MAKIQGPLPGNVGIVQPGAPAGGNAPAAPLEALDLDTSTFSNATAPLLNLQGAPVATRASAQELQQALTISAHPAAMQRLSSRSKDDALKDADNLLRHPLDPPGTDKGAPDGTQITAQPVPSSSPDCTNPSSQLYQAASAQVVSNALLEAEALKKLTPEQRAEYLKVKAELAGNPVAQLALQEMLLQGRLPGSCDSGGHSTLLDNLARLADPNTPLASGIDRATLLGQLVMEVANPACINDGDKGTCTVGSVEIMLARTQPAEYVRIAMGLASPEGQVRMANGDTLTRDAGTATDDHSGRSISQRLMQPAFMVYANNGAGYDNAKDAPSQEDPNWAQGVQRLINGLFNQHLPVPPIPSTQDPVFGKTLAPLQAVAMAFIRAEVAQGHCVPVALLNYAGGPHEVVVTGITKVNGVEYVTFINPWGREERMPLAEFQKQILNAAHGQ